MDSSAPIAKTLQLEHLPAFVLPDSEKSRVQSVFHYLQKLVDKEVGQLNDTLELPSISNLSHYFRCSPLEIYDALRELRHREYDYHFSKFDQPVRIWLKADPSKRRTV